MMRAMARSRILVHGEPDDVLLAAADAVRRSGARITRYDVEETTLEARRRRWAIEVTLRLRAETVEAGTVRLEVEVAAAGPRRPLHGVVGWLVAADFRRALTPSRGRSSREHPAS